MKSFLLAFRYAGLRLLRSKEQMGWCLVFPLLLGTMFYMAFSNLSDSDAFDAIPVAVVLDDSAQSATFQTFLEGMDTEDADAFLDTTFVSEVEALKLLEEKKVDGILYGGANVSLTVSSDMTSAKLNQSILNSFVETYQIHSEALYQIASTHPDKMDDALKTLKKEVSYNTEITYSTGNMDDSTQYFFNLLAMICLYASLAGCQFATENQANLSDLGARKCISPVNKFVSISAGLAANMVVQFVTALICLFYLTFILHIDFGNQFFHILLSLIAGCMAGVSFGFLIGSIGNMSKNMKDAILTGGTLFCCFLSGLMMGNIRIYIEKAAPIVNRLNPAALISDSLYALSIYSSYERYWRNIISLLMISVLFCIGGFLLVRRKKYASL